MDYLRVGRSVILRDGGVGFFVPGEAYVCGVTWAAGFRVCYVLRRVPSSVDGTQVGGVLGKRIVRVVLTVAYRRVLSFCVMAFYFVDGGDFFCVA